MQVFGLLPIFAANKKRKGLDMLELMMILGATAIGLGVGLMSKQEPEKKSYTRKKKKKWTPRHLPYKYNHLFR